MSLVVYVGLLLNYADDSSSLIAVSSARMLFSGARFTAGLLYKYCCDNFLTVNASKSVILQFRNPHSPAHQVCLYVAITWQSIQVAHSTKYFGAVFDRNFHGRCMEIMWSRSGIRLCS
jgi:hypothetical protein